MHLRRLVFWLKPDFKSAKNLEAIIHFHSGTIALNDSLFEGNRLKWSS